MQQILAKETLSNIDSQAIIQSEIIESAKLVTSQQQSLEQSFEIIRSLLDVYPYSISAQYYTALLYLKAGDFSSALNHLLQINTIIETRPEGFESEITHVIEEHPERFQSEVWNHIGVCYTISKYGRRQQKLFEKV